MKLSYLILAGFVLCVATAGSKAGEDSPPQPSGAVRTFTAHGVVMSLEPAEGVIVIRHGAISNYMAGMTMPFKVADTNVFSTLHAGDEINFRLLVGENASHVDNFVKTGTEALPVPAIASKAESLPPVSPKGDLLDYKFTNELGQAVSLNDFRGQALGITFFYTRCPLPDYCPRLSKNFEMACDKLKARPGAPTNWHFLSISFDPEFDTPEMLKSYAGSYQADPAHWSFLTGPPDKIAELARAAGVNYRLEDGTFNHNFRTLILDANGQLQMVFPTSGDLSDLIVNEIIKAAAVTNQVATR